MVSFADDLNAQLEPWQTPSLTLFAAALALMFQPVADLIYDQGEDGDEDYVPGWGVLFDPDLCPAAYLPYLAQFVGVRIPAGMPEASARLRVKQTDGQRRGTVAALEGAARQYLEGPDGSPDSATVYVTERTGSAYTLTVATIDSETPDQAVVLAALMEQKPAGLLLTYTAITGGTWADLAATHADWADVDSTFTDWADVRSDPTQT